LLLAPLRVASAAFLFIACMLLCLRFVPLLLRFGMWLAARSRGAPAMLALAQMARAPRQSIRMTLLLAFATAFAIFALIFDASQNQHILDVSLFQGSADFSGTIVDHLIPAAELDTETAAYNQIPGVISTSLGYTTSAMTQGSNAVPIEVRAVDANDFAQAAFWTKQYSTEPLSALMQKLIAQRSAAVKQAVLPAIVDAATWNSLHLDINPHFALQFSSGSFSGTLQFVAVAQVQYIPTVSDSTVATNTGDYVPSGGVLVDFQTYRDISLNNYYIDVPLNYAWLRTRDDAKSLASVRKALTTGPLRLNPLLDRRANIAALHVEPLYLTLIGLLAFGATVSLLLAVMGNLIASWLSARKPG
jgi:putative ABC transport system permease protein